MLRVLRKTCVVSWEVCVPEIACRANLFHKSFTSYYTLHHSSAMLLSKVSLLSCQHPFCLNFNKKPFATQAAYTQHIDRNIGCYNFIVKRAHVAAPHGASVSRRHRLHEDGDVAWTSNKRPSLLRRHMVNDVAAAGDLPVVTMAQYLNAHFIGSDRLLQSPGDGC